LITPLYWILLIGKLRTSDQETLIDRTIKIPDMICILRGVLGGKLSESGIAGSQKLLFVGSLRIKF
jgi:hypothetical protein